MNGYNSSCNLQFINFPGFWRLPNAPTTISITFLAFWKGVCIFQAFCLLSPSLCGLLLWQNPLDVKFFPCLLLLFYFLWVFTPALTDDFSLEFEWQQVSLTLLSILANLDNPIVWMVSTCSLISNTSSPCTNLMWIVPSAPITVGCILSFYDSLVSTFFIFVNFLMSYFKNYFGLIDQDLIFFLKKSFLFSFFFSSCTLF